MVDKSQLKPKKLTKWEFKGWVEVRGQGWDLTWRQAPADNGLPQVPPLRREAGDGATKGPLNPEHLASSSLRYSIIRKKNQTLCSEVNLSDREIRGKKA